MAAFTLDDIRAAAEAAYGSTDITLSDGFTVSLLNPMRLPKAKRDALIAKQRELDVAEGQEADVDQEAVLADSIRIVANSAHGADRLLESCAGDLAMLLSIFKKYSEATQVGEASGSQD